MIAIDSAVPRREEVFRPDEENAPPSNTLITATSGGSTAFNELNIDMIDLNRDGGNGNGRPRERRYPPPPPYPPLLQLLERADLDLF